MTLEEANNSRKMLSAKWINHKGVAVAVSPAAECDCMLSNPSHLNRIKRKGMQTNCKGNTLVDQNNFAMYSMADVPPILEYEIVLKKGNFNRIRVFYNICTDPSLGIGWAAISSCCLQLWAMQGTAEDAMDAASGQLRSALLCRE